jgi:hypothetical protein
VGLLLHYSFDLGAPGCPDGKYIKPGFNPLQSTVVLCSDVCKETGTEGPNKSLASARITGSGPEI